MLAYILSFLLSMFNTFQFCHLSMKYLWSLRKYIFYIYSEGCVLIYAVHCITKQYILRYILFISKYAYIIYIIYIYIFNCFDASWEWAELSVRLAWFGHCFFTAQWAVQLFTRDSAVKPHLKHNCNNARWWHQQKHIPLINNLWAYSRSVFKGFQGNV